jgi:hypothetical protein
VKKTAAPGWPDVKTRIRSRSGRELLGLIRDLYKQSAECRSFLNARLLTDAEGHPSEATRASFRVRFRAAFFGRGRSPSFDLRLADARRAIREYRGATRDLQGTLDLMLAYLEAGTEFTNTYGDIDGPFYDSLMSMMDGVDRLLRRPEGRGWHAHFRRRLLGLSTATRGIAWGYGDHVRETIERLERGPGRKHGVD